MLELHYNFPEIKYIIENTFKFADNGIETEYIKLKKKQLIKWFIQCSTQDENGNDDVDNFEKFCFYTI